jgi:hypothetical protein
MKLLCSAAILFCTATLFACQKASDATVEKKMPKLPPPPRPEPAASLRIAVEIDGQPGPPIDAARLRGLKPDFEDAERRAWRLETLLGARARDPETSIAVTGDNDVTVVFRRTTGTDPVLALSRRGEIVAALVEANDPFPSYHGQGRRLHRPGDPTPRVGGVKRIRVYRGASPP